MADKRMVTIFLMAFLLMNELMLGIEVLLTLGAISPGFLNCRCLRIS
ncbi:hypothetical protein [Burkholderia oklahomensis]|nr:hypothetical protein [Burkholderia oklahomensis]